MALDILVHVAMAGEGLDSVYVTEVVHLNPANINNQNNQENGRASRVIPEIYWRGQGEQVAYINVDSTSPYSEYTGEKIMACMDDVEPERIQDAPEMRQSEEDTEWEPLPEWPNVYIADMECIHIDEGVVRRQTEIVASLIPEWGASAIQDPGHPIHAYAIELCKKSLRDDAEAFNAHSLVTQWHDKVNLAVSSLVNLVVKINGTRLEKSIFGDVKKRINKNMCVLFGPIASADIEGLKVRWAWVRDTKAVIIETKVVPEWLM